MDKTLFLVFGGFSLGVGDKTSRPFFLPSPFIWHAPFATGMAASYILLPVNSVPASLCQNPEYSISCAGCCGMDNVDSSGDVMDIIRRNSSSFRQFMERQPSQEQLMHYFRDETVPNTPSGLCAHVIFLDEVEHRVGCAAHPALHGTDFRTKFNLCYAQYHCKQAQAFARLPPRQQQQMLESIAAAYQGDNIQFSIDMEQEQTKLNA